MIFQILLRVEQGASALLVVGGVRLPLLYHLERQVSVIIDKIKDLPNEEWREIKGYKGKYLVSNKGRIKSLKHRKAKLLTAFANNKGYLRVALCKDGQPKYLLVSRLVAEAFCDNSDPENANTVDHIDGDTLNNCADNLRWLSFADNMKEYSKRKRDEKNGKT